MKCKTCDYDKMPRDGGFCYMRKDAPSGECGLHSERPTLSPRTARALNPFLVMERQLLDELGLVRPFEDELGYDEP